MESSLFHWACQKFNFSNWTIIKGDTAIFVNQSQNPLFVHYKLIPIGTYVGGLLFVRVDNIQR